MENNTRNAIILQFLADDDEIDAAPLQHALDLLYSDSDEEPARAAKKVRNESYAESIVPKYTDRQFEEHFRMSRSTMEELVNVLGHYFEGERVPIANVPLEKKVLFSTWVLSKQESFLAVGDRFDIATSSGHIIFKSITVALKNLMPEYVKWPTAEQQNITSKIFEERSRGIPGVIGAIDGCHIPIKAPSGNMNDFYNRNNYHSIILQGICDHAGCFIDVFIGMPGRMHDARVFKNSELYEHLTNTDDPLLPADKHLIGDKAYPLMVNLLTPVRDNGHLPPRQVRYNNRLSACRSIIERTFGMLVGKFRRLKYLDIAEAGMGNTTIAAACMLLNFLKKNDSSEESSDDEWREVEMAEVPDENDMRNTRPAPEAVLKRNHIINTLT